MRKEALVPALLLLGSLTLVGCGMVGGRNFPGIVEPNPYAVNQAYPVPAYRVAQTMRDVLAADPFYKDVKLVAESRSRGSRPLSREERASLGANAPTRDVNFSLTAKTVNNHRVAAVIQLKGESGSEASVLFDTSGDPAMSRSVLDAVQTRLVADAAPATPAPAPAPAGADRAEPDAVAERPGSTMPR